MDEDSKRQKITHLSQREWVKQRPETFFGATTPVETDRKSVV